MTFARWWMNLADYVDSPTFEWSWLDYRMHNWCWRPLNIIESLAILAPSIIFKAIFQHRRPKIAWPSNNPFHLVNQFMSSTNSFMDFTHEDLGIFWIQTLEQHPIDSLIIQLVVEQHIFDWLVSKLFGDFLWWVFKIVHYFTPPVVSDDLVVEDLLNLSITRSILS